MLIQVVNTDTSSFGDSNHTSYRLGKELVDGMKKKGFTNIYCVCNLDSKFVDGKNASGYVHWKHHKWYRTMLYKEFSTKYIDQKEIKSEYISNSMMFDFATSKIEAEKKISEVCCQR